MDLPENHPTLIDYVQSHRGGLCIDPELPPRHAAGTSVRCSPFSKIMPACVVTDGGDTIQRVILLKQRDRYVLPDSMVTVTNPHLEEAWQGCLAFHRQSGSHPPPMMVKHQMTPSGTLQPFNPLFVCLETRQWFHPVCPQCGLPLALCRDDELLQKRGLPAYTRSLDRYLACNSCVRLSDASPLYCREPADRPPEGVLDAQGLVDQWKQLLANLPDDAGLPCRGCPSVNACYGPEQLAHQRLHAWAFYPFFMLMFPAPTLGAAEFIRLLAGGPMASRRPIPAPIPLAEAHRFLFQNQDRMFLEVLLLKLTFLEQVVRQVLPDDHSATRQEVDLALDGIGIDLHPCGTGLPQYWNFNARILDAVGSFRTSPFAPGLPMPPRLHFLGALWFRTLLVNSRQDEGDVYGAVKQTVDRMTGGVGPEAWSVDPSDPSGVFAADQVFWSAEARRIPEAWQLQWQQALRLGLQLVQAGLKTGVAWDRASFMAALDSLRKTVRSELFSTAAVAGSTPLSLPASGKIRAALNDILERWQVRARTEAQTPAAPWMPDDAKTVVVGARGDAPPVPTGPPGGRPSEPDGSGLDSDIQATVILNAMERDPSRQTPPVDMPQPPGRDSDWSDDNQATVVIRSGPSTAGTPTAATTDNLEKTMVISPGGSGQDDDLDATVVIKSPQPPPVGNPPHQSPDDALDATMVQSPSRPARTDGQASAGEPAPASAKVPPLPPGGGQPGSKRVSDGNDDIMEQTIIIRSNVKKE